MMRPILALACSCILAAADAAWPDLPDPIGLGPRLVTIEWLRERGSTIPAGMANDAILKLYREANRDPAAEARQDAISRLTYLLKSTHGIVAPDTATPDQLQTLYNAEEAKDRKTEMEKTEAIAAQAAQREASQPTAQPETSNSDADIGLPVWGPHQIEFKDLLWSARNRAGATFWQRGDAANAELPSAAGRITGNWVTWMSRDYRVTAYRRTSGPPKDSFNIDSAVGSFRAVKLTEHAWMVQFTDNAGSMFSFKTYADELVAPTQKSESW